MKVLVTSSPLLTHLWDVVPLSWALRSRGHDVRVATLSNFTDRVVATGLTAVPAGQPVDIDRMPQAGDGAGLDERLAVFARSVARMSGLLAPGLDEVVKDFRPDLVLHEPLELAGPMVAQELGVPAVHQSWGPAHGPRAAAALRRAAARLRERFGRPVEVRPPSLVVDVCPPSFQDPGYRLAAPHQSMRYVPFNGPGALPAWLAEPAKRPRVCVTVGTVLPGHGGLSLVSRIVRAIAPLDLDIVVPLRAEHAGQVDVDAPGVRVVDWFPLRLAAHTLDLVIHQAGPGTALTLLGFGVPQLTFPIGAERQVNAQILARCGAGRWLPHRTVTDAEIVAAVDALLSDRAYRAAAGRVAAEIAAQPTPADVAAILDQRVAAGWTG